MPTATHLHVVPGASVTSRNVSGQSFTHNYDAENRLVSVTGAATANFVYDGDGKQVKATVNPSTGSGQCGTTTVYIGQHYEVKNGTVTKYYTSTSLSAGFAGATRLAVQMGTPLSYLLSDHLSIVSLITDANFVKPDRRS